MPHRTFYRQWHRIRELIDARPSWVVTSHIRPDGDAAGSCLALARTLEQLGCEATVILQDPVPRVYDFLPKPDEVHVYEPDHDAAIMDRAEVVFVLDVGSWERVGRPGERLAELDAVTVCIDHHARNGGFADIDIVFPDAPATGSLIAECLRELGGEMSRDIAEPLYVAIATDCGWFRFSNATPEALAECAELADAGLDIHRLYEQIYERCRWESIRLQARALSSLQSDADGRIAWFKLTRDDFAATDGDGEDCEGLLDIVRTIAGVELILFFRETADGLSKGSLRSKCDADVAELAALFGGGGHRKAAGFTNSIPLARLIPRVLEAARNALADVPS